MQLYRNLLSSSLSSTVVASLPNPVGGKPWSLWLFLRPATTGLLSAITVTVRWDDGVSAKAHTEVVALTTLGLFSYTPFPVFQDDMTDITIEATLTGLGTCEVFLCGLPLD